MSKNHLMAIGLCGVFLFACSPDDRAGNDAGVDAANSDSTVEDGTQPHRDATNLDGAMDAAKDAATDAAMDAQTDGGPNPQGPTPILYNFRINADHPDRVLFDATADVSSLTTEGFVIPERTIVSVTIRADKLGGFFTVDRAFDFWDNDTIRLGEIEDPDHQTLLHNFSLTYIQNNIPEPESSTFRYVTSSATGGGDGLTEATAWTLDEAAAAASPGMTIWIKAGQYPRSQYLTLSADGTRTNPIKWVGYKSVPGDITSNYLTSYDDIKNNWNPAEMPTLVGPQSPSSSDIAILLNGADWNIIRNIQTERFGYSLRTSGGSSSKAWNGLFVDNFNSRENVSATDRNMSGINIRTAMADTHHFIRIKNSVFLNHTMAAISLIRDDKTGEAIKHFLIDNVRAYSDYKTEPEREDYFISVSGHFGIVRNCQVGQYNDQPTGGSVHGIGVRGQTGVGESTYILFDNNEVFNVQEGIYVRNSGSNRNVFKNNRIGLGPMPNLSQGDTGGMVMAWGGCDFNLFENNLIEGVAHGLWIRHNAEDPTPAFGKNNLVRNNVFVGNQSINANSFIYCSSTSGGAPMGDNSGNKIYHNTIVAYRYFYSEPTAGVDINLHVEIKNNLIVDFTWDLPSGTTLAPFEFVNNLIHDTIGSLNAQVGQNGNFDVDPLLDVNYFPQADFNQIAVPRIDGIFYDYHGMERSAPTTVGAITSTDE